MRLHFYTPGWGISTARVRVGVFPIHTQHNLQIKITALMSTRWSEKQTQSKKTEKRCGETRNTEAA